MDEILNKIDSYYSGKLAMHGATPRGVDWNSEEAQRIRFDQLTRTLQPDERITLLDYGCGYGAMVDYLEARNIPVNYVGFDVSKDMVETASRLHAAKPSVRFISDPSSLDVADYVVASGIFSVKMDVERTHWEAYVHRTIDRLNGLSRRGFSFNLLTAYSDVERMRPDLYYADPHAYFDLCRSYSKWVALLHDYGLYEFTLSVTK